MVGKKDFMITAEEKEVRMDLKKGRLILMEECSFLENRNILVEILCGLKYPKEKSKKKF